MAIQRVGAIPHTSARRPNAGSRPPQRIQTPPTANCKKLSKFCALVLLIELSSFMMTQAMLPSGTTTQAKPLASPSPGPLASFSRYDYESQRHINFTLALIGVGGIFFLMGALKTVNTFFREVERQQGAPRIPQPSNANQV